MSEGFIISKNAKRNMFRQSRINGTDSEITLMTPGTTNSISGGPVPLTPPCCRALAVHVGLRTHVVGPEGQCLFIRKQKGLLNLKGKVGQRRGTWL